MHPSPHALGRAVFGVVVCMSVVFSGAASGADVDKGRVARAMFTTGVDSREPVDQVLILKNSATQLYFFTDLRHMQGQTVTHRWEYEGRTVMTKSFDVRGPRWRVYSKKDLAPEQLGRWTVVVVNEQGWPLKAQVFRYIDAAADDPQVIVAPGELN